MRRGFSSGEGRTSLAESGGEKEPTATGSSHTGCPPFTAAWRDRGRGSLLPFPHHPFPVPSTIPFRHERVPHSGWACGEPGNNCGKQRIEYCASMFRPEKIFSVHFLLTGEGPSQGRLLGGIYRVFPKRSLFRDFSPFRY
jgi:hypothetical protein